MRGSKKATEIGAKLGRGQRRKKLKENDMYVYGDKDVDKCIKNLTDANKPFKKRQTSTINGESLVGDERQDALDSAMLELRKPSTCDQDNGKDSTSNKSDSNKAGDQQTGNIDSSEQQANIARQETSAEGDTSEDEYTNPEETVDKDVNGVQIGETEVGNNVESDKLVIPESVANKSSADTVTAEQTVSTISPITSLQGQTPSSHTSQNNETFLASTNAQLQGQQNAYAQYTDKMQQNDREQTQYQHGTNIEQTHYNNNMRYTQPESTYSQTQPYNDQYYNHGGNGQTNASYMYNNSGYQDMYGGTNGYTNNQMANDIHGQQYNTGFRYTSQYKQHDSSMQTGQYNNNLGQNRFSDVGNRPRFQDNNNAWSRFPGTINGGMPPNNSVRFNPRMPVQQQSRFSMPQFQEQYMTGMGGNVRPSFHSNTSWDKNYNVGNNDSQRVSSDYQQASYNSNGEKTGKENQKSMTGRFINLDELTQLHKQKHTTNTVTDNTEKQFAQSETETASSSLRNTANELAQAQAMMNSGDVMDIDHEDYSPENEFESTHPESMIFDVSGVQDIEPVDLADSILDMASENSGTASGSGTQESSLGGDSSLRSNTDNMLSALATGNDVLLHDKSSGAISKKTSPAKSQGIKNSKDQKKTSGKNARKGREKKSSKASKKHKKKSRESRATSQDSKDGSKDSPNSTILEDVKVMVIRVKQDSGKVCQDKDEQLEINTRNIEMLTRMLEGLHLLLQKQMTATERESARHKIVWSVDSLLGLTAEDYFPLGRLKVVVRGLYNKGELIGHTAMGKGKKKPPVPKDERWEVLKKCAAELDLPEGKHVDAVNAVCRQKTQEFKGLQIDGDDDDYSSDNESSQDEDND